MTLEAGVALAVLFAGALHAGWNTLVKTGGDKAATLVLIMLGEGLAWLPVGLPQPESWPFLGISVVVHL